MLERHPWREVCKGSEKYASWNRSSVADWKTHWLTLLLGRARLFSKVRGMDWGGDSSQGWLCRLRLTAGDVATEPSSLVATGKIGSWNSGDQSLAFNSHK